MTHSFDPKLDELFALAPAVRYAAINIGGTMHSREAPGLVNASSSESDKYEELIVNPALLTLAQLRGDIDCGGAGYLVIGYGNFTQTVVAIPGGHASIAFEAGANPLPFVDKVRAIFES